MRLNDLDANPPQDHYPQCRCCPAQCGILKCHDVWVRICEGQYRRICPELPSITQTWTPSQCPVTLSQARWHGAKLLRELCGQFIWLTGYMPERRHHAATLKVKTLESARQPAMQRLLNKCSRISQTVRPEKKKRAARNCRKKCAKYVDLTLSSFTCWVNN